eukprot:2986131-Rhodomonas_salina.2
MAAPGSGGSHVSIGCCWRMRQKNATLPSSSLLNHPHMSETGKHRTAHRKHGGRWEWGGATHAPAHWDHHTRGQYRAAQTARVRADRTLTCLTLHQMESEKVLENRPDRIADVSPGHCITDAQTAMLRMLPLRSPSSCLLSCTPPAGTLARLRPSNKPAPSRTIVFPILSASWPLNPALNAILAAKSREKPRQLSHRPDIEISARLSPSSPQRASSNSPSLPEC